MKKFTNQHLLLNKKQSTNGGSPVKYRGPMPGFVMQKQIGLGSIIQGITMAVGITPCEACKKRAAVLNRKIVFGYNIKK